MERLWSQAGASVALKAIIPARAAHLKSFSCRAEYGAFMEPSGRNQWQPLANASAPQAGKTSQIRCPRLPPVACELPW
jgi:hypothetical protein